MNFTTPTFLFYFLPFVLLIYFVFPSYRNFTLILSSGLFYFWSEGYYLFLFYIWILINFFLAKAIFNSRRKNGKGKTSNLFLILSIIINLSILAYFKYYSFIVTNLNNFGLHIKNLDVYLPLAMSFFTFHTISYNFDIFRGKIKPESNIFRLILYFTLFPHLIAGPIIRFQQIHKELSKRVIKSNLIAEGIQRFTKGLLKKVLLANTLANVADEVFAIGPYHINTEQAWIGLICFSLQIYYDFSGYTDMAIGLGKIFGFNFPENFNYPYIASSLQEFWRRWHITLSNWIRDYIYIPLGGNRKGEFRTAINLIITFSLAGLWHGANWNFVIWGLYHSFFLILERIRGGFLINWMPNPLRHAYTLFILLISWLIFRSVDFNQTFHFLKVMFSLDNNQLIYYSTDYFLENDVLFVILVSIIFTTPFPKKVFAHLSKKIFKKQYKLVVNLANLLIFIFISILSLIFVTGPTFQSFIYFRF